MPRNPLRFVVLMHDWPSPHFDLMLERGGVLKTWRLAAEPNADRPIILEPLADHRTIYLDYEGPVSGGRGTVCRWDRGPLEWIRHDDDQMMIDFHGEKLTGRYELMRDGEHWTMMSRRD